jgi:uncharacterized protein (TIGR00290 family)
VEIVACVFLVDDAIAYNPNLMKKIWMCWSTGKDSAFALYELRAQPDVKITGLLTTINETHQRVAMHAVREDLLQQQAEALNLPLFRVPIPYGCPNELYESRMSQAVAVAINQGVTHMAFGDLFLEDVRQYRERMLESTSLQPLFPIWGRPTRALAEEMIASGHKAVITCVDPKKLPKTFAGREFDSSFLSDLPENIDPCGENGEFHSFVYNSPLFKGPIAIQLGEIVERDGFIFADLLPS